LEEAIHCRPAHDLGERVLTPRAADLPYSAVWLLPLPADHFAKPGQHARFDRIDAAPAPHHGVCSHGHLAIDIELPLVVGAVPDPDRARALVPSQVWQRELLEVRSADKIVDDP